MRAAFTLCWHTRLFWSRRVCLCAAFSLPYWNASVGVGMSCKQRVHHLLTSQHVVPVWVTTYQELAICTGVLFDTHSQQICCVFHIYPFCCVVGIYPFCWVFETVCSGTPLSEACIHMCNSCQIARYDTFAIGFLSLMKKIVSQFTGLVTSMVVNEEVKQQGQSFDHYLYMTRTT